MRRRDNDADLVYGAHAVRELIETLPDRVRQVLVDGGGGQRAHRLSEMAKARGIEVRVLPPSAFRKLSKGRTFQGIAARVDPHEYAELQGVVAAATSDSMGLIVVLDSLKDPQNLGSVIRTAAFFGVHGIIIPKDRCAGVTPAVIRASAGAALNMPVVRVTNLTRTLTRLQRDEGMTVIGAVAHGGSDPVAIKTEGPIVLVLGSEEKGLRRLVSETCDLLVTIRSPGGFESLNVGVSAGILIQLFSCAKQVDSA